MRLHFQSRVLSRYFIIFNWDKTKFKWKPLAWTKEVPEVTPFWFYIICNKTKTALKNQLSSTSSISLGLKESAKQAPLEKSWTKPKRSTRVYLLLEEWSKLFRWAKSIFLSEILSLLIFSKKVWEAILRPLWFVRLVENKFIRRRVFNLWNLLRELKPSKIKLSKIFNVLRKKWKSWFANSKWKSKFWKPNLAKQV